MVSSVHLVKFRYSQQRPLSLLRSLCLFRPNICEELCWRASPSHDLFTSIHWSHRQWESPPAYKTGYLYSVLSPSPSFRKKEESTTRHAYFVGLCFCCCFDSPVCLQLNLLQLLSDENPAAQWELLTRMMEDGHYVTQVPSYYSLELD